MIGIAYQIRHGSSLPHRQSRGITIVSVWVMLISLSIFCSPTFAVERGDLSISPAALALADQPAEASEPLSGRIEGEKKEEAKEPALPLTIAVSYYLQSDYVYRGVNFSEYPGEGREKPNHQLSTSISWDFKEYGTLGFDTFYEWYAAQAKLNPFGGQQNCQEVDYVIWWKHAIEPITSDFTLGYSFYTFPNSAAQLRRDKAVGNNNNDRTMEWWFKLAHNDAWMWTWLLPDNKDGVLNPTFFLAQDVGVSSGAVWIEVGFSHTFKVPCIENLTITPGYTLAFDGGYTKRVLQQPHAGQMRMGYEQLSLNVTYDLTPVLKLPKWAGTVSLSGLLYFNDAFNACEDDDTMKDVLFGGMSVNWGWGGSD